MVFRTRSIALLLLAVAPVLAAAQIDGTIVIQRKLTKKSINTPVGLYQRGVAVAAPSEPVGDPLAYERSHVVIYLDGDLGTQPTTLEMSQKDRRFAPEMVVIPVGSTISFPNLDPIFHNVFSLSKPRSFDLGNYTKDHTRIVNFPKPGIVFVNCHLHPNMTGVIVVTPNRWSTRSDEEGHFSLDGLPPGPYTVVAWHKTAGFFRQTIQVTRNQTVPVRFFIPLGPETRDSSDKAP